MTLDAKLSFVATLVVAIANSGGVLLNGFKGVFNDMSEMNIGCYSESGAVLQTLEQKNPGRKHLEALRFKKGKDDLLHYGLLCSPYPLLRDNLTLKQHSALTTLPRTLGEHTEVRKLEIRSCLSFSFSATLENTGMTSVNCA